MNVSQSEESGDAQTPSDETERAQCCGNCKYSQPRKDNLVECHRYAPRATVIEYQHSCDSRLFLYWPILDSTESCGEFRAIEKWEGT